MTQFGSVGQKLSKYTREDEAEIWPADDGYHVIDMPEEWLEDYRASRMRGKGESPSSIRDFLGCPLQWMVKRHTAVDVSEPPNIWAVSGSFTHRILEIYYREAPQNRSGQLLWEMFNAGWAEINGRSTDRLGIIDDSLRRDFDYLCSNETYPDAFRGRFYNMIRDALQGLYNMEPYPQNVDVIDVERWSLLVWNGIPIRGKIDRTVSAGMGEVVIEDYKTGKVKGEGDDTIYADHLIAMGIYALSHEDEKDQLVRGVRLLHITHETAIESEITNEKRDEVASVLNAITSDMEYIKESGRIPYVPNAEAQCAYCPIRNACPAWGHDEQTLRSIDPRLVS